MRSRTALMMRQSDIVVYVVGKWFRYRMQMLPDCSSSRISRVNSSMPRGHPRPAVEKSPAQGRMARARFPAEDRVLGRFRRVHRRHNLRGSRGPLLLIPPG